MDDLFQQFSTALMTIAPEYSNDILVGIRQLKVASKRLAYEVLDALSQGVNFSEAVVREMEYPLMYRMHVGVTDLLQKSLPEEMEPLMHRFQETPQIPVFEKLRENLAQVASFPQLYAEEDCALARFLLFQGIRLNLVAATWIESSPGKFGPFDRFGGSIKDLDRIAEEELVICIAMAEENLPDGKTLSFNFVVAGALQKLHQFKEVLCQQFSVLQEMIRDRIELRAFLETHLREMDLKDALLVRNYVRRHHPEILGEQHVSFEILQIRHPLAFGKSTQKAMRKASSRLKKRTSIPTRKQPALFDFIRESVNGEEA